MRIGNVVKLSLSALIALNLSACGDAGSNSVASADKSASTNSASTNSESTSQAGLQNADGSSQPGAKIKATINPEKWPALPSLPLNPQIEAKLDEILSKLSLEQKVGQIIQADSNAVTPEEVKTYRLGSVLSGGNSAPGELPYAAAKDWLAAADAYFSASIDDEGVELAVPIIWGIDAVHGHTNLLGGTVFPHNVGLGAANDPNLVKRIAQVTAKELAVSGHDWTFAPTLAVPQNDRWGRAYEGFSESPDIVRSYGGAIVEGLQGRQGSAEFMQTDRVISTAKHFLADGGTQNGVDQGDARISEQELIDIHVAGYISAIEAGAQSVMASFSSWQGDPLHGHKALLTDVLKGRMNFNGFVIGDWNGHALIPGCTATDCPQSLNAGLDMYMAPDSWKGLYESTLRHVKSGKIPMERLDDAVRRILRVKLNSGVFDKALPSQRDFAGQVDLLGVGEHRDIAREAVRKSLVLLKNNDKTLPLSPKSNLLIVGKGANNIAKLSGGWTLSWQGGKHTNDEFPNGQTLLSAIKQVAQAAGGSVTYDEAGTLDPQGFDAVIAIYGEDPYAEFRGDLENVDFTPNDFDPKLLKTYRAAGLSVTSVFLSGRPLWTNPEINASDAFVAAWLPGSEAAGIADLLFQTRPDYDFTGRLSFSWPANATQAVLNKYHSDYAPLFPLGYGLSYGDNKRLGQLPEESGLSDTRQGKRGVFFTDGANSEPWRLAVNGVNVALPYQSEPLGLVAYDRAAQEDSLRVDFNPDGEASIFSISSQYGHDLARESNGAMELSFFAKAISKKPDVEFGMGCAQAVNCDTFMPVTISQDWKEYRIALKCFESKGAAMSDVKHGFLIKSNAAASLAISEVILKEESSETLVCR